MLNRVVFLSSLFYPNVGGVENSIREMSRELQEKGVSVTVVSSDRNFVDDKVLKFTDEFEGAQLYRCRYPYGAFGLLVFVFSLYKVCIKLRREGCDLVVARSHWPAIICRLAGFGRVNYIVPSVFLYQEQLSMKLFLSKGIFRVAFNSAGQFLSFVLTKVYVFSETMRRQVRRATLGLVRAEQVKPGISRNKFKRVGLAERNEIRERIGVNTEDVVLVGVGRFSEIKQFDVAIKSLKFLPSNYKLMLVGGGAALESYVDLVNDIGLAERVYFFPFQDDVSKYYQAADVYVMSSRYEAFGQVLLEATSCGLPVAAFSNESGVNTATEQIYEGYNFLASFSRFETAESLARAIEQASEKRQYSDFIDEVESFSAEYDWNTLLHNIRGL